eukprot:TRINITY_DN50027_c0_g1_i1.p2 TRINITY_DN50027_c0_g1~~TRINITY_DN50027_c0_g1_i1.p2  ORF type:complete len:161 (-),score=44.54 TRINITY_DN50027_c0_g1_i1:484-966(-)
MQQQQQLNKARTGRVHGTALRMLCRVRTTRQARCALLVWRAQEQRAFVRLPKEPVISCARQVRQLRQEFTELQQCAEDLLTSVQRDSFSGQIEQLGKARLSLNGSASMLPMPVSARRHMRDSDQELTPPTRKQDKEAPAAVQHKKAAHKEAQECQVCAVQ